MTERKYFKWKLENLQNAVRDFKYEKIGLNECARKHNVPKATLKRHLDKDDNERVKINKGRPIVFNNDFEQILVDHLVKLEQHMFGLTIFDVRRLAFQFAEANNVTHNFNHAKGMEGKAWYYAFMKRHKEKINLRQAEATTSNRAKGFNRENINGFFDILENVISRHELNANKIFNVDESRFQSLTNKRDANATMIACASASGQFIPPMIIFKRTSHQLTEGAPAGSIVAVSESGYINCDLFYQWLLHFISVVKLTKEDKVLLLLDGHTTHSKSFKALKLAREKGVILLQLPGHTTHRLQPLDVSFLKPMSTCYTQAIGSWMRTNPGGVATQHVSRLINEAYEHAVTIGNIANGFRAAGIWPVNRNVFQDHFAPTVLVNNIEGNVPSTLSEIHHTSSIETLPSTSQQDIKTSHYTLSPIPKNATPNKGRGIRKAVKLKSSSYKRHLESSREKCKRPGRLETT